MSLWDEARDMDVRGRVRSFVVVALWLPVIIILFGVSVATTAFLVRYALFGALPDLSAAAGGAVDPSLVALGGLGALAFLYLVLARVTFGGKQVEAAQDQFEQVADEVEKRQ